MPHYVIQLEHERRFAVYSTIVDGLLTPEMSGADMRKHLESNGYESWLRPYDYRTSIKEYERITGHAATAGHKRLFKEQTPYFYFNAMHGFCYAKLSDAYFCLPRSAWRNGR